MKKTLIPIVLLLALLCGCARFASDAHKTIYVTAITADGAMKTYAAYWKDEVLKHGKTPELLAQSTNVMAISVKVGSALAVADHALATYEGKIGTNTTTQAVVNALIATAIQEAGAFESEIGLLTSNTNLLTH